MSKAQGKFDFSVHHPFNEGTDLPSIGKKKKKKIGSRFYILCYRNIFCQNTSSFCDDCCVSWDYVVSFGLVQKVKVKFPQIIVSIFSFLLDAQLLSSMSKFYIQ